MRDKRVHDNLAFFVRHGLLPVTSGAFAFHLLLSGTAFHISLPARRNVLVHDVGAIAGKGQMSHYKAFLSAPERYKGCATVASCSTPDVVVDWRAHGRILFLSDVVRGPFLPSYVEGSRWPSLFLSPLSSNGVKLVGATISCEHCGTDAKRCSRMLHVESPVFGTDAAGLELVLRQWRVMRWDRDDKWAEIYKNEVGMSMAVLKAGHNLASHQRYWKGHDFRNVSATSAKCAALASRSVKRISQSDRTIKPRDGDHETNLHAWYLPKGGSNCKGCYWGIDLPPTETMFVHHYTSPQFRVGAAAAYAEMDMALERMMPRTGFMASVTYIGESRNATLTRLRVAVER